MRQSIVDFFSIGTNDLTQYTLAAERGNEDLAALADPLDPAVLKLIDLVCRSAETHGVRVAVCGEAAADPIAIPVLAGLEVRELSVSPPLIAAVKDEVRSWTTVEMRAIADAALEMPTAEAVRNHVVAYREARRA